MAPNIFGFIDELCSQNYQTDVKKKIIESLKHMKRFKQTGFSYSGDTWRLF